jgi:hypothetical protein
MILLLNGTVYSTLFVCKKKFLTFENCQVNIPVLINPKELLTFPDFAAPAVGTEIHPKFSFLIVTNEILLLFLCIFSTIFVTKNQKKKDCRTLCYL